MLSMQSSLIMKISAISDFESGMYVGTKKWKILTQRTLWTSMTILKPICNISTDSCVIQYQLLISILQEVNFLLNQRNWEFIIFSGTLYHQNRYY